MSSGSKHCLIIGGGVIGLSIAYELARQGRRVTVVERNQLGKEASWAGAGILPPPAKRRSVPAWEQLHALSYALHPQWHRQLLAETGIDNGYRLCGGIYLARRPGEAAGLRAELSKLLEDDVEVRELNATQLASLEPNITTNSAEKIRAAFLLPDEAQIRNPRHLQALAAACRRRNVEILENEPIEDFETSGGRLVAAISSRGRIVAEQFCLTAGAWSETLAQRLGLTLSIYPVRGQMILFRTSSPILTHIINEGPRYLVPRDDGHVLAGSTEEDVGFEKRTTEVALRDLQHFATALVPALASAEIVQTWAGLRPHAVDGFPYLGRVSHLANAFVAAGHYRNGLATSTGTAVLMRQLMAGQPLAMDIAQFRLNR